MNMLERSPITSSLWLAYVGAQRLVAGQSDGLPLIAGPRWDMETLPPLHSHGDKI